MDLYDIITTLQEPHLTIALEAFVEAMLPEFKAVLAAHPLKEPHDGRCSVAEAFWLYWLVKTLEPRVVIESGTSEGYSLWFLKRAAPEDTRVIGFDPYHEPDIPLDDIEFYKHDWMCKNLDDVPGLETLIFFDDHFNQQIRVEQCVWRGVRHAVFHDNYLTAGQGHLPLRYASLHGLVKRQHIFSNLRCDEVFTSYDTNQQFYRWLTYVEVDIGRLE